MIKPSMFAIATLLCVLGALLAPTARGQSPVEDRELVETLRAVPRLKAGGTYEVKNNTVVVELSEYAGYAGLVVANKGLEPNEDTVFFRKYGFKVKLTVSEEESWSKLNSGEIAASATTADVLAVYGRQLSVEVPALIGFSRGADGVVVRQDIKRIDDLAGKVVASAQFTEADFLIRYLAREAGLEVNLLDDLSSPPAAGKLNLVYCADGFAAGDLFLRDVKSGRNRLAACVTWAPRTDEIVAESGGKLNLLVTNRNLLLVADVLMVNRGLAKAKPEIVAGLVAGLMEGNAAIRTDPKPHLPVIAKAFGWDAPKAQAELGKVHLANLPENLAFFDGTIDAAGSYGYIVGSAQMVYGKTLADTNLDPDSLLQLKPLRDLQASGQYANQKVALAPIRKSADAAPSVEGPILSKNVQFNFEPNSAKFDSNDPNNAAVLREIARTLKISPGSTILLRGHADPSNIPVFRRQGGEALVQEMSLKALQLSKDRTAAVARALIDQFGVDQVRISSVGRGYEEPLGDIPEKNRRVEVQWFTLE